MNLMINIDSLVLQGFTRNEGEMISRMIRKHLSNLLTRNGIPDPLKLSTSLKNIDAGTITFNREMNSRNIGREIAQNIYTGLSGINRSATQYKRT